MTDQKDPAALARRFIDLWHDQLRAMSDAHEQIRAIQRWWAFGIQAGLVVPPANGETRKWEPGGDEKLDQPNRAAAPTGGTPSGPQAAGAALGNSDTDMDDLARRVQELEARLSALEPGAPASGSAPPGRPRQVSPRRRPNR